MIFSDAHIMQIVCGYLQFDDVQQLTRINHIIRTMLAPLLTIRTTTVSYHYGYINRIDDALVQLGLVRSRYVITIDGSIAKVNHSIKSQYTGDAHVSWAAGGLHMTVVRGVTDKCTLKPYASKYCSKFIFTVSFHYIDVIDIVINYMQNIYANMLRRGPAHEDTIYVKYCSPGIKLQIDCEHGCKYSI